MKAWVRAERLTVTYEDGLWRDGVALTAHGGRVTLRAKEEELNLSGAFTETTDAAFIPDRAVVLGVASRTTLPITGATSYGVGVNGNSTQFGNFLGTALGSTNNGVIGPIAFYADTKARVTANGGNALPQQEIGEALLAAGADQEVHVGQEPAGLDGVARGVVDREPQLELRAGRGGLLGLFDRFDQWAGEPVAASDHAKGDAVFDAARSLGAQVSGEEPHQRVHLLRRPFPVVGGEGEQRERTDALGRGRLDDAPHGGGADAVARRADRPRRSAQRPLPSMMIAMCRRSLCFIK